MFGDTVASFELVEEDDEEGEEGEDEEGEEDEPEGEVSGGEESDR